ncbi:unnamed protein product [Vitrella brassicaformis CCMP3155]|uniref:TPM domain-containing protein n=1 Tax=Vitrella brassicaformis (strain CCMP3155) TaxID=1169540 RepID=A0A0G4EXK5_VITBC|nr:unnamed protein product [Vitrella brassicaformis CCMP3155]|mmetsp:Transcript_14570/g.41993  ORF Transcript_14570/g.41993 Transcript_14570/m.41993 type:complete len:403 (-) Transcript_14570:125-1333(-)|eukprot:CEM03334.1 unnamed protein product [Vitrella brassicaformis CCMP3155]
MAAVLYAFTTVLLATAGIDAVQPGAFVSPISPPTTPTAKRSFAGTSSLSAFRVPGVLTHPSLTTLDPSKLTPPAIVKPARLVKSGGKRIGKRFVSSAEAAEIAADDESTITVPDGGQGEKFSLSGIFGKGFRAFTLPSGPFPNPQYDLQLCGLRNQAWICDPDGILPSVYDREGIQRILNDIRDNCKVACPDGKEKGFQVGVALVRKMLLGESDDKYVLAAKYATAIGNQWGVGDKGCDNGLVFFLSRDDKVVHIRTANQAAVRVSNEDLSKIIDDMKPELRREDYTGAIRKGLTLLEAKLQDPSSPSTTITVSHPINDDIVTVFLISVVVFLAILWAKYQFNNRPKPPDDDTAGPKEPKTKTRRSTTTSKRTYRSYSSYGSSYSGGGYYGGGGGYSGGGIS